jgi:hypothetical protein
MKCCRLEMMPAWVRRANRLYIFLKKEVNLCIFLCMIEIGRDHLPLECDCDVHFHMCYREPFIHCGHGPMEVDVDIYLLGVVSTDWGFLFESPKPRSHVLPPSPISGKCFARSSATNFVWFMMGRTCSSQFFIRPLKFLSL